MNLSSCNIQIWRLKISNYLILKKYKMLGFWNKKSQEINCTKQTEIILSPIEIELINNLSIKSDEWGYVSFWDLARNIINMQAQYAARYVDWAFDEYPNLWKWLRFKGNTDDYHFLMIHKDDILEFVKRFKNHKI